MGSTIGRSAPDAGLDRVDPAGVLLIKIDSDHDQ
jgi:hypothetical protein